MCLPDQFLNQFKFGLVLFCFVFLHPSPSISHCYYCYYCCCSQFIVFATKNLGILSILPLLLVFLFFFLLLILLHLFAIVSFFHCFYSYQVNTSITVSVISFVNFLKHTFAFDLQIVQYIYLRCFYWLKINNLIPFLWLSQKFIYLNTNFHVILSLN